MKNVLYLFLFVMMPSWAGLYPIITSVDVRYRSDGANYYITQELVEIGPQTDQVLDSGYWVGLVHKHKYINDYISVAVGESPAVAVRADNIQTIGELAIQSYDAGSKRVRTVIHTGSNGFEECVAYAGYRGPGASWNSAILPGGCLLIPPASQWCKITTPEIVLDHGTIMLRDVEGHSASANMGVQCTTATAVQFKLISDDNYIYLDEGKAEIMVEDAPLNTKIDLPSGTSNLQVKDLLTGVTSEGLHTGSSVLVMMPY